MWKTIKLIIKGKFKMFNKNSGLVKIWFGAVMNGTYQYKDVPNLSNLREQVKLSLIDMGYDTENEGPPTEEA